MRMRIGLISVVWLLLGTSASCVVDHQLRDCWPACPAADPCAGIDCSGLGTCLPMDGQAHCVCPDGYQTISRTTCRIGRPHYAIAQATQAITIDGHLRDFKAGDSIFIGIPATGSWARFQLLWDAQAIYLGAEVRDQRLYAVHTERDSQVYNDDSIELMVDSQCDRGTWLDDDDYKFMVNLLNAHRDHLNEVYTWDAAIESAVVLDGSNTDDSNTDHGYVVEMRIPWSEMGLVPPVEGQSWGFDVYLNDNWQGERHYRGFAHNPANEADVNIPADWGTATFTIPP